MDYFNYLGEEVTCVFFGNVLSFPGAEEPLPTATMAFLSEDRTVTITLFSRSTRLMEMRGIPVASLMQEMSRKRLARSLGDDQFVVSIPNGSCWRPDSPISRKRFILERATLRGKLPQEESEQQVAKLNLVRVNGACRALLVGLRLRTLTHRVRMDVSVEHFSLALLHIRALVGCGAPPGLQVRFRTYSPFWVRLPVRDFGPPDAA